MQAQKRSLRTPLLITAIVLVSISLGLLGLRSWQSDSAGASPLEKSVLQGDWAAVLQQLEASPEESQSAESRALRAHACLATNRNNESLKLFTSLANNGDQTAWSKWTEGFAARRKRNHVAHYLRGDALARQKRWSEAVQNFDAGLKLSPEQALLLNARGAAHSALGQMDAAIVDFDAARRSNPSLADVQASYGAYWVQKRTGPQEAIAAFDKALALSPGFATALCGRAAARLALGLWQPAFDDLKAAHEQAPWLREPATDLVAMARMRNDFMLPVRAGSVEVRPGTSIEARVVRALPATEVQSQREAALHNEAQSGNNAKLGEYLHRLEPAPESMRLLGLQAYSSAILVKGPRGISAGTTNDGWNVQIIAGGTSIRLDRVPEEGQESHVNWQPSRSRNKHIPVNFDFPIKVRLAPGAATIFQDGKVVETFPVAPGKYTDIIEIERKPNGTTTITVNGKEVEGTVEETEEGIKVRFPDRPEVTIPYPPKPAPKPEGESGEPGEKPGEKPEPNPQPTENPQPGTEPMSNPDAASCVIWVPGGVLIYPPTPPALPDPYIETYPISPPEPPGIFDPIPPHLPPGQPHPIPPPLPPFITDSIPPRGPGYSYLTLSAALLREAAKQSEFWHNYQAKLQELRPDTLGGATSQGAGQAYIDRGKWLGTVYGLAYPANTGGTR